MAKVKSTYIAFCDILGFSNQVLSNFEDTILLYEEFRKELDSDKIFGVKISLYSDSLLIFGDDLIEVAQAVNIILWVALRYGWLVRGGIAYGKQWKESNENNLFIVSEGLVKAVNIEKTIKYPIIALSTEIEVDIRYWANGFVNPIFAMPIIHYQNRNIVNPFNFFWFQSAEHKLKELKLLSSCHVEKYNYLLDLINAIKENISFIPSDVLDYLIKMKIIKPI